MIYGTEKAWPRKGRFMRSVPITLEVLPPMYPKDLSKSTKTDYNKYIAKQTKQMEELINKNYSLLSSSDSDNSSTE